MLKNYQNSQDQRNIQTSTSQSIVSFMTRGIQWSPQKGYTLVLSLSNPWSHAPIDLPYQNLETGCYGLKPNYKLHSELPKQSQTVHKVQ
jgi:hypothetical protein